jgi:hypothetical protein
MADKSNFGGTMSEQNNHHNVNEIAEQILADVLQSLAEYSFVHSAEQLQQLVSDPETDPIFLQEVKDDILEILNR